MSAFISDVDTADFQRDVVERSHEVPVLVDFWAEWCGPCKVLSPTIERIVTEAGGRVRLAKIDSDRNQQLAAQMGVQGIPTVIAFKDGQPVNQFTGALPEAQVRDFINALLPNDLDLAVEEAERRYDAGEEDEAERILQAVLEANPGHQDAGVMLAGLLLDRSDGEAAMAILQRLVPTEEVTALMAATRLSSAEGLDIAELEARVAADPSDEAAALDLARARGAIGDHEAALAGLLELVEAKAELADEARMAMLDIFEVLGHDAELVGDYRRRLAAAIF
jgi:putative thioredoxin